MRFVSWNVNGLRAAIRKGIDAYFEELEADVMMLQETRTLEDQLPKDCLGQRGGTSRFTLPRKRAIPAWPRARPSRTR